MEGWGDLGRWLHSTYRDGLLAHKHSPIQILTRSGVEQLRWSDTTRYHYATPPTQHVVQQIQLVECGRECAFPVAAGSFATSISQSDLAGLSHGSALCNSMDSVSARPRWLQALSWATDVNCLLEAARASTVSSMPVAVRQPCLQRHRRRRRHRPHCRVRPAETCPSSTSPFLGHLASANQV